MAPGNIILLNGAASAAKTKIIAVLQSVLNTPYLYTSFARFSSGIPNLDPSKRARWAKNQGQTFLAQPLKQSSPLGGQLITGMHQTIAVLAHLGHHVIVDHTSCDSRWLRECAELFCELPTFFVGVLSSPIMLEPQARGSANHTYDQGQAQLTAVHIPGVYDLELDTALFSPLECAMQIKHRMQAGPPSVAMSWLKAWEDYTKPCGWLSPKAPSNLQLTTGRWL